MPEKEMHVSVINPPQPLADKNSRQHASNAQTPYLPKYLNMGLVKPNLHEDTRERAHIRPAATPVYSFVP